jgi:ABC-type Fe3+/spermidine/putrescine transport system ATPase subunit
MTTTEAGEASGAHGHRVTVRGASKRFGATTALSDVGFEVTPGQFLVLLGPSGSGKSTLIRLLAGIEGLDDGIIQLSGRLVSDARRHLPPERRDLAMVFQDYALWPHLTVAGNVGYALRRRRLSTAEARQRVAAALDRVGLGAYHARYPHELSGGEQQRVALARAVVAEPRLLLFDEPLSNLDADLRERLRVEIATLTRETGASAVYITHDQAEAFALADQVGVLDRGRLAQLATPEEIYRRPATPFVARFTGSAGELPGMVTLVDGGSAEARVGDGTLRARAIGAVRAGDAVRVLVRPAATRILSGEADVPSAMPSGPNLLRGVVADVAYRGRGYDHVVRCEQGSLTAVYDAHAHARGECVTLSVDPEHCVLYGSEVASRTAPVTENSDSSTDVTTVNIAQERASAMTSKPVTSKPRSGS